MLVTTGKVHGNSIEIEPKSLPDGATVTVLAQDGDESFELGSEDEARLLAAIAEAGRGEAVDATHLIKQIRRR